MGEDFGWVHGIAVVGLGVNTLATRAKGPSTDNVSTGWSTMGGRCSSRCVWWVFFPVSFPRPVLINSFGSGCWGSKCLICSLQLVMLHHTGLSPSSLWAGHVYLPLIPDDNGELAGPQP